MDVRANPALVNLFFKEIMEPKFNEAYNKALPCTITEKIGMQVPSTAISSIHGWVNQIGRMSEWVGPRISKNVSTNGLEIFNRTFENNVTITVPEFLSDQHNMYALIKGPALGWDAAYNRDRLLMEALLRGNRAAVDAAGNSVAIKWADGLPIFTDGTTIGDATTRSFDGVNPIVNRGTLPLTATNLRAVYTAMNGMLGHGGQPLIPDGLSAKFTLLTGPQLDSVATQILDSEYTAILAPDGTTYVGQGGNPNKGLMEHIKSNIFTNGFVDSKGVSYNAAYNWFVVCEIMGIKPLVYQSWQEPFFQYARATLDCEFCYQNDAVQWGVTARGEGFVGIPWLIYGQFATA